jgi:hypothetical protein
LSQWLPPSWSTTRRAPASRWASVQVPAVGAGVQPADEIDQAADSLEELGNVVQERLGTHDEVLEQLRDRITALEDGLADGNAPHGSSRPTAG